MLKEILPSCTHLRVLLFINIKKKKHTPNFVLQKGFIWESYVYKKDKYFNFIKKLSFFQDLFKCSTNI